MTDNVYDWNTRRAKTEPGPVTLQPHTTPAAGGYGPAALARELETLLDTTEGGRNHQLNVSAFNLGQLVASGHLNETEVRDQLRAVALRIGLEPGEIRATINSGLGDGAKLPRHVTPLAEHHQVEDVTTLTASPFPATSEAETDPGDDDSGPRLRTSWHPQPIALRAAQGAEEPAPTHLHRDDQQALFYSGKVNGLIGESESGKSWVALLAAVQAITQGQRVLILDFEDSPASVERRLRAFGCQPHQLELVDYADPDEALGIIQTEDLSEALTAGYQVIVADGINAAMTLLGYDLNSNTDATLFATKLLRPLARTGACVITVDHVPKNPEQRGKGGIGAQAKRAMLDGCALLVEVLEPFGKGQSGTLRLTVDKDRNGAVRGISSGGRYAGKAQLDSIADQVRITITAPDTRPVDERGPWRPTGLMEKISRYLEHTPDASANDIVSAAGSRKDVVLKALAVLVEEEYVTVESGPRRARLHTSAKPYRQAEDPDSDRSHSTNDRVVPTGSRLVPGTSEVSGSGPVPPYGDGNHSTPEPEPRVVPVDKQPGFDMPNDHSSCNHCGRPTPDREIDDNAGYCHECARLWGQR